MLKKKAKFFVPILVAIAAMMLFRTTSKQPTVAEILKAQTPTTGSSAVSSSENFVSTDVTEALKIAGVSTTSADGDEEKKRALAAIQHEDFWRTHSALHANSSRVKNWLWVHERYRKQLDEMLRLDKTSDRAKAHAAFSKWCKKLSGHSEYEDTMLFKFFVENSDGPSATAEDVKKSLKTLMGHHENKGLQKQISKALAADDGGDWAEDMMKYVNDMKEHLLLEERTLVGPWLNLDDEAYKKYRSYLSWKYAAMY